MAAQAEDIKRLKERLEGHPGPVLSVYLSVNAQIPENQSQAYKVRLKDALREMEELPEEISGRVWESVEGQVHQHARTLVFFAAGDGLFERYELQLDLPEAYHFGEPYLAPLVLALDEHESYGVALVDAEEFRFFVSAPMSDPTRGSDGASSGYFREVAVSPESPGPRSGMDQEDLSRRTEENRHKFYNQLGELTQKLVNQDNVKNLIIAGPKERTSDYRSRLPEPVKEKVVAEEAVAANAPENEILEQFEEIQQKAERAREEDLIEQVRENGVRGINDTIEALQEGRVYHLVALYDLDGEIRWCDHDQLAITDIAQAECPYCGRDTRVRDLTGVIIDLATARGARLEYVRMSGDRDEFGETPNEDIEKERNRKDAAGVLREEFEGLAGLLRY